MSSVILSAINIANVYEFRLRFKKRIDNKIKFRSIKNLQIKTIVKFLILFYNKMQNLQMNRN